LREARAQAEKIRAAAEKEVAAKMADAQEEAREIIQQAVEDAKKEAERARDTRLTEADREEKDLMNGQADVIDRLVDQICETLLTTDLQSGK
jgi:vacuolar-type H+-ATPase subunit E/Vma4